MAANSARKLFALRRFSGLLRAPMLSSHTQSPLDSLSSSSVILLDSSDHSAHAPVPRMLPSRRFCSHTSSKLDNELQAPAPVDYSSMLQEEEFHKLADSTIHDLLEKFEEYGDNVQMDGFDIDYGNQVLTLKLGDQGTYVLNKQTPNRQLWLSSPVSGPARFDWDPNAESWVYRRNNASLRKLMEMELEQLCGEPIDLS